MRIRGTLTITFIGVGLISAEVVQRTVIALLVRLFPSRRERILAWWIQRMADMIKFAVERVGGANVPPGPRIPGRPGVLVIGNHQSLMDIPVAVGSIRPLHPRVVTRSRYARGKPLISHLIRLYQYPTVDPRSTSQDDLEALRRAAAESPVPFMIYPEGTRTRDGGIGKIRRNGLRMILGARDWEVWLLTVDGFWQCAKLNDFLERVNEIDGRVRLDGPWPFDGRAASEAEMEAFIDGVEEKMHGSLARLRAASAAGSLPSESAESPA